MEHQRIDEGIARKSRYAHRTRRRNPETGLVEAMPADADPDQILQRYLTAPKTSSIASELGVRRSTLTWWLRERVPARWKMVQIIRALARKEDGDEGIESANDALSLARARELLRSAQWELERLDAGTYGQKQEITVQAPPDPRSVEQQIHALQSELSRLLMQRSIAPAALLDESELLVEDSQVIIDNQVDAAK